MIKSYSFSQNTFFYLIASVVAKILVFFYFIFLARYLGPKEFGIYSVGLSFIAMFGVLIDLGFSTALVRETAKDRDKTKKYLENLFSFRLILAVATFFIIFIAVNLLKYSEITRYFIYLAAWGMIFESLAAIFYASFRGWQNLRFEAIGLVLDKFAYVFFGFILILFKAPVLLTAIPLILGGIFYFIFPLFIVQKKIKLQLSIDKKIISFFFKISLPLILGIIFSSIFGAINTVLVSLLASEKDAGLFSAAFRIPSALLFIPMIVGAAIFPVFSRLVKENQARISYFFEKVFLYLIFISLPLIFGGIILGKEITIFMYGRDFLDSTASFQILLVGLVFTFLDFVFSSLLTAFDKQKANSIARGIGLLVNIVLCFILIPHLKHLGGSIAFTVGFIIFGLVQVFLIHKLIPLHFSKLSKLLPKVFSVFFSSLIMGAVLFIFRSKAHVFVSLIVGVVVYSLALYFSGGLKRNDLKEILGVMKSSINSRQNKIMTEEKIVE